MALLPRLRCPHCGKRTIRRWVGSSSAPSQPARCREYGGLSYLSMAAYLLMAIGGPVAFFAGIVAPLVLQNAWALVLLPLGLAAVMGLGGCFPLRPMAAEAIEPARARARRATTWMIGLMAALVVWRLLHQYWRG